MKRVSEAVYKRLLGMEDEELKAISNDDLENLIAIIERLCKMLDEGYCKPLEKFKLALANKCLQSTNLPKRLHGLASINKLIEMALRKEVEDRQKGVEASYVSRSLSVLYLNRCCSHAVT